MTLRTEPSDDEALERLAQHFGVSKHQAVLMAIRQVDCRMSRTQVIDAIGDEMITDWKPVLDRLATT